MIITWSTPPLSTSHYELRELQCGVSLQCSHTGESRMAFYRSEILGDPRTSKREGDGEMDARTVITATWQMHIACLPVYGPIYWCSNAISHTIPFHATPYQCRWLLNSLFLCQSLTSISPLSIYLITSLTHSFKFAHLPLYFCQSLTPISPLSTSLHLSLSQICTFTTSVFPCPLFCSYIL